MSDFCMDGKNPLCWLLLPLAFLPAGCGSSEPIGAEPDAEPEPPECDGFARGQDESYIDQGSYDAMNYVWGDKLGQMKPENWNRHTRIYFGAATPLYRTVCEEPSLREGDVGQYMDDVAGFFDDYYATKANSQDDGILVLIGGLAPADVSGFDDASGAMIEGALGTMAGADATQKDFSILLQACYWYNMATAKAADRFFKPSGRKLSASDKGLAKAYLSNMDNYLNHFADMDDEKLNQVLDDRQQELLFRLMDAAIDYRKTLDGSPPPPKCTLQKAVKCKKQGKVLDEETCKCVDGPPPDGKKALPDVTSNF